MLKGLIRARSKKIYRMVCVTDYISEHPSLQTHEETIRDLVEERYAQGYSLRGVVPHEQGSIFVFVRPERK